MKFFYIVYQYFIVFPILLVITFFTALMTILFTAWKNSAFIVAMQRFWARCFYYLCFIPVEVTGKENLQEGQSYVFVCNHQSIYDVFVIYGWLPVVFKWILKQELRKIPFVGVACEKAGHIFIDRSNVRKAFQSVETAKQTLQNGVCVVIFPEGTRTFDGQVAPFRHGAFKMAFDLDLPIVPLSLNGCYELMNRRQKYLTWHRVKLHIDKPIYLTEEDKENRAETIEKIRNIVIKNI